MRSCAPTSGNGRLANRKPTSKGVGFFVPRPAQHKDDGNSYRPRSMGLFAVGEAAGGHAKCDPAASAPEAGRARKRQSSTEEIKEEVTWGDVPRVKEASASGPMDAGKHGSVRTVAGIRLMEPRGPKP